MVVFPYCYDCGVFGTGLSRVWHLTLANTDGWTCGGWYGDVIAKPKISGIDNLTFTISARLAELRYQEKHKSEPLSKEYPTVNQANRSWRLRWVHRFPPSPHILLVSFAYGLRLRSPVLSTLRSVMWHNLISWSRGDTIWKWHSPKSYQLLTALHKKFTVPKWH